MILVVGCCFGRRDGGLLLAFASAPISYSSSSSSLLVLLLVLLVLPLMILVGCCCLCVVALVGCQFDNDEEKAVPQSLNVFFKR